MSGRYRFCPLPFFSDRYRIGSVMARRLKDSKVQIWVTAKEKALLELVAERKGLSKSELARKMLRRGLAATLAEEEVLL